MLPHTIILIVLSAMSVVLNGVLLFMILRRHHIDTQRTKCYEAEVFQAFSGLHQDLESLSEKFPEISPIPKFPEIPNHSKDFEQLKEGLGQISKYFIRELEKKEVSYNAKVSLCAEQQEDYLKKIADVNQKNGVLQGLLDTAQAKENRLNEQISRLERELRELKSKPQPAEEQQDESLELYKANVSHLSSEIDSLRGRIYQTTTILHEAQSGDSPAFIREKIDDAISILSECQ